MAKAVSAALASVVLTGCATGMPGFRPLSYQEPAETRVLVSDARCPHNSGPNAAGGIISAIAIEAASKLLEQFGTALTNAAQGGALPQSVSHANFNADKDSIPQCVFIVRGQFSESDEEAGVDLGLGDVNFVGGGAFPVIRRLDHYVEMQVLHSSNRTALTLAPVLVRLGRSMDGSASGDRALSIAVSFEQPGQQATGSALLLSGMSVGAQRVFAANGNGRYPYEMPWFASFMPNSATNAVPVTIRSTVIETRPTREFLAFVAAVFAGTRETITQEVTDELDPAVAETASQNAAKAEAAYNTALALARSQLFAYCAMTAENSTPGSRITKAAEVRNAQDALNRAAATVGISSPFGPGELVSVTSALPVCPTQ